MSRTDSQVGDEAAKDAEVQTDGETSGGQLDSNDMPRRCLACGYDLSHLGPEPRCPECGLRHVPQGYREQTWAYVDSGRPRFVSPLGLLRKRPPGWWWSLDRPGDIRRSLRFLTFNFVAAFLVALFSAVVFGGVALEVTNVYRVRASDGTWCPHGHESISGGAGFWASRALTREEVTAILGTKPGASVVEIRWLPHWGLLPYGLKGFIAWLIWVWVFPALAGLMTQIRKGLPDYAHPPSTILVAGNYESTRLVYGALGLAVCMAVDAWLRINMNPYGRFLDFSWHYVGIGVLIAASWIGPLRSDHTSQLVRSRAHAVRIIVMYALVLPLLVLCSLNFTINVLVRDRLSIL